MWFLACCRLIVDLSPARADEELIYSQNGDCADCHEPLPSRAPSNGLSSYLWFSTKSTGPRRCEYTNLLYCHKCHNNETEVIPSHVLHNWDFSEKPVSAASNLYLKSIKSLPVLCLGTVNPGLFARVPLLANAQSLRQKIVKTLSIVRGARSEGKQMAEKFIADSGVHIDNKHLPVTDPNKLYANVILDICSWARPFAQLFDIISAGYISKSSILCDSDEVLLRLIEIDNILQYTLSITDSLGPPSAGTYGYLLENPDFWSLRDLIDISKGSAFSSLPRWLECASGKVGHMATSAILLSWSSLMPALSVEM